MGIFLFYTVQLIFLVSIIGTVYMVSHFGVGGTIEEL